MDAGGGVLCAEPDGYAASATYERDLDAARSAWSESAVLGTAGAFVFLTHLSLPNLVSVRSSSGAAARSILDGERERSFLCRLVGLDDSPRWRDGIRNGAVRRLAIGLGERHSRFVGMKREYHNFIGAIIALAPLRARRTQNNPLAEEDRSAYWRYMSHAMALVGAEFGPEPVATEQCRLFVDAHADASIDGLHLFNSLYHHHPKHVHAAVPALFDTSRAALQALMARGGSER
jgi:hypothetical protein